MKCKYRTKALDELCLLKTGTSVARAEGENPSTLQKVLLPRAMSNGVINQAELDFKPLGDIGEDFFTKEGDVVVKLSTPYDSVYVGPGDEGIFVTSSGLILRKKEGAPINMQFLSMFLNSSITVASLAAKSTGQAAVRLIKKTDVANTRIPLLPIDQQNLLAELFHEICKRRNGYENLIKLDTELAESRLADAVWGE